MNVERGHATNEQIAEQIGHAHSKKATKGRVRPLKVAMRQAEYNRFIIAVINTTACH